MLIYDIPTDTWTESTATLSSPRSDLCMAAVGGVLYAAGAPPLPSSHQIDRLDLLMASP